MKHYRFQKEKYSVEKFIKTYKFIAPEPVEKGVSNFFSNLKEPIRTVSFIFQGEFYKSFNSLGRFTINTLTYLKEKYPNFKFNLIMGEDNLRSFKKWKN